MFHAIGPAPSECLCADERSGGYGTPQAYRLSSFQLMHHSSTRRILVQDHELTNPNSGISTALITDCARLQPNGPAAMTCRSTLRLERINLESIRSHLGLAL